MMEEIWKVVPNYPNYMVSNHGRVKTVETNRVLRGSADVHRYKMIALKNNTGTTTFSVHRLVAEAFIDNPENKQYVNHKNRNKMDNHVNNLEWVTHQENMAHVSETGRKTTTTAACEIELLDDDKNVLRTFRDQEECAVFLEVSQTLVSQILRGVTSGKSRKKQLYKVYCNDKLVNEFSTLKHLSEFLKVSEGLIIRRRKDNETFHVNDYKIQFVQPTYNIRVKKTEHSDEIWKPIPSPDMGDYEVSNLGRMRNIGTRKIIHGSDDGRYLRFCGANGNRYAIHRLVALTFCHNDAPDTKVIVNHIDGNTKNNNASNLEWCSQRENVNHARTIRPSMQNITCRKVCQLELNGKCIKVWDSMNEAYQFYKNDQPNSGNPISSVCSSYHKKSGKWMTFEGFGWCWLESYDEKNLQANPAFYRSFPNENIDLLQFTTADFDKVRDVIKNKTRPVWQIELNGEPLNLFPSATEACLFIGSENTANLCSSAEQYLIACGYAWSYASFKEVISNTFIPRGFVSSMLKAYPYLQNPENSNKQIDCDNLRKALNTGSGSYPKPVWQIDHDGIRIQKFWSGVDANNSIGVGRNNVERTVDGYSIHCNGYIWERATIYIEDDEYTILPLSTRAFKLGRGYCENPIARVLNGIIVKVWRSRRDLQQDLGYQIGMSSTKNLKYITKKELVLFHFKRAIKIVMIVNRMMSKKN